MPENPEKPKPPTPARRPGAPKKPKRSIRKIFRIRARFVSRVEMVAERYATDVSTIVGIALRQHLEWLGQWPPNLPIKQDRKEPMTVSINPVLFTIAEKVADAEGAQVVEVVHRAVRVYLESIGLWPNVDPDFFTKQH